MNAELGLPVTAAASLRAATRASDAIVTCTSASQAFLDVDDVRPGTFIAAVGADNPHKSEIAPPLMARATVVVDVLEQCVIMGDLHHAIAAGTMTAAGVQGELGALVAGRIPGRRTPDEITLFDSSGTGIQDVAASARAYELAVARGVGTRADLT